MSIRATVLQAVLVAVLQLASLFALATLPKPETDRARLSTPIVKAWRDIPAGSPVHALDDAAGAKDWLARSLVERIGSLHGYLRISLEPGYSVFVIYPYLSKSSPQPSVYQGIYLKVKGELSVDDLSAAIRNRSPNIKIDAYDVFGAGSLGVQRYSRTIFTRPSIGEATPCNGNPKVVGSCFTVSGQARLGRFGNDAPSLRIWPVGTNRVLEVPIGSNRVAPTCPDEMVAQPAEEHGDFDVCPFTDEKPGHAQMVCVESVSHLVVRDQSQ